MATLWSTYGKTLAAFLFAVVTVVQASVSDGHITQAEGIQIAIAAVTAFVVWWAPVLPDAPLVKTVAGVALAILNALATLIVGGISSADIAGLILAGLTALGVGLAPAQSTVKSVTAR